MLTVLITLTVLGFVACFAGGIWMLVVYGRTERREGTAAGAEVFDDLMEDDDTVAEAKAFRGRGIVVSRSAAVEFGEIKAGLRQGQWRALAPVLLAAGGLLTGLLFGSLALFVGLEDKLVGGLILALVLFTVGRILWQFGKS